VVDISELHITRTATVAAPPEAVFDIIADVTRIGELSPICKTAWWDEGADPEEGSAPKLGAWFTGRNEMSGRDPWERHCEIVLVDPGRAIGWIPGGRDQGVVEWSYQFRPVADGTEVEESWRMVRESEHITAMSEEQLNGLVSMTESGIEATLANLKAIAEA
jgi:uncharacterized protein YndB with AHSA1/START domain